MTPEIVSDHSGARLLPLPFAAESLDVVEQAEAALILHADEIQRAALLLAGLRLLTKHDLMALTVDLSEWLIRTGAISPPFLDLRKEASDWARFATLSELRAYCGACLRALPEADVATLSAALARRVPA